MNTASIQQLAEFDRNISLRTRVPLDGTKVQKAITDPNHPLWKVLADFALATVEIFLSLLKKIKVSAVLAKKTADCFTNKKRYYHRDGDLDRWLPEDQQAEGDGEFSVLPLEKQSTFKKFLDFQIGKETTDVAELSTELKRRGYITTLTRIEALIEEQESGTDVGLRTDGYANFFLVLDKEGDISVVGVGRDGGQWYVYVCRLAYGGEWGVGSHLFLRN